LIAANEEGGDKEGRSRVKTNVATLAVCVAASIGLLRAASPTDNTPSPSGETRGYVISWFYPSTAVQAEERDCPHGMNAKDAATNVLNILRGSGFSPSEIEKAMDDFPTNTYTILGTRARINGEPADPYLNPTAMPDLHLKTVEGQLALGLDLDGNEETGGFTNPEIGEKGVDNQLFRVYGCSGALRANPGARPTWNSDVWQLAQPQMPAWLIEIEGIRDLQNSSDVVVRVTNATSPVVMDAKSEVQADMTFQEDGNPDTTTSVHGAIKNGVLTTDVMPMLNLYGHRVWVPERRWTKARIRLTFQPDGSAKGLIAGYHKWAPLYAATMGAGLESDAVTVDIPSLYYAFRRLADADPDPALGLNTSISTAFSIEAVPAFIRRAPTPSPHTDAIQTHVTEVSVNHDAVLASPPGIRIKVIRIGFGIDLHGGDSNQPRERTVFSDETGFVFYTSDEDADGRSHCLGECAQTWIPAWADPAAKPMGSWSVLTGEDGARQWAFRGQPLYTFATDVTQPQYANDLKLEKHAGGEGKGQDINGHHVLEIRPDQWMTLPSGFHVQEVRAAPGYVLTDAKGLPVYTDERDPSVASKHGPDWTPFAAPGASEAVGDFAVLSRRDGRLQWTYKGKPLYRFSGDLEYGDANGESADADFKLVYALRYFMPQGVAILNSRTYGGLLASTDGTPLYARDATSSLTVRGDRGIPSLGEKIGVAGCDTTCEASWLPLIAPDEARPQGYWTVIRRPDRRKQWAYYGYGLYRPADRNLRSTEVYDQITHFEALPNGAARRDAPLHWRVSPP
jgi:predicted lipoprotein with Yx(FWY)xxD motif